eukprot:CAMPEP_0202900428 /NCGR_PEP_ID=MMETSP1392-20130828/11607_1 /ASSEMBLY_ACC=CAM_ASM_000868 /TAXON_ID=225041 /ORGANISM="Chlamydomonas chlamydogama, Strain SAG 11-48b" /LENGTH=394 /DNA_ID=CAMNT_0049586811 /DNA_START=252 /DNA_END=1432 /DNA_ORIENTATION=+
MSSAVGQSSDNVHRLRALKRLQHDMKELQECPVEYVTASPIKDDILKWSATMVAAEGRWQGLPVHMHIKFPDNYPDNPPEVVMVSTQLNHPNVFGSWICLDMIKEPMYYSKPYTGWSSTYTLAAVLRQLYGFLLVDEVITQQWGGQRVRETRSNNKWSQDYVDSWVSQVTGCTCGQHALPADVDLYAGITRQRGGPTYTPLSQLRDPLASSTDATTSRPAPHLLSRSARKNFARRQRRRELAPAGAEAKEQQEQEQEQEQEEEEVPAAAAASSSGGASIQSCDEASEPSHTSSLHTPPAADTPDPPSPATPSEEDAQAGDQRDTLDLLARLAAAAAAVPAPAPAPAGHAAAAAVSALAPAPARRAASAAAPGPLPARRSPNPFEALTHLEPNDG